MIYANIEYLAKNGEWRTYATIACLFAESLVGAITRLANEFDGATIQWRVRIRH